MGGTGSGFGNLLQERLENSFEKKYKVNFEVWPEKIKCNNSVVGIYNAIL